MLILGQPKISKNVSWLSNIRKMYVSVQYKACSKITITIKDNDVCTADKIYN